MTKQSALIITVAFVFLGGILLNIAVIPNQRKNLMLASWQATNIVERVRGNTHFFPMVDIIESSSEDEPLFIACDKYTERKLWHSYKENIILFPTNNVIIRMDKRQYENHYNKVYYREAGLSSLDPKTGKVKWQVKPPEVANNMYYSFSDQGAVFLENRYWYRKDTGLLRVIDMYTGQELLHKEDTTRKWIMPKILIDTFLSQQWDWEQLYFFEERQLFFDANSQLLFQLKDRAVSKWKVHTTKDYWFLFDVRNKAAKLYRIRKKDGKVASKKIALNSSKIDMTDNYLLSDLSAIGGRREAKIYDLNNLDKPGILYRKSSSAIGIIGDYYYTWNHLTKIIIIKNLQSGKTKTLELVDTEYLYSDLNIVDSLLEFCIKVIPPSGNYYTYKKYVIPLDLE